MTIQSIGRAIQVLNIFSLDRPRLGISEISQLTNLKKATVQGIVRTLTHGGFLQQDPETRKYQLGLKIYELGHILAGSLEINQKASSPAHILAIQTGRLVRVAILDNDSALVTLDAYPRSQPFISQNFGPRAVLYCSALGKAILAFFEPAEVDAYFRQKELIAYTPNTIIQKDNLLIELEETRRRGYSTNLEEFLLGRASIGAPIFSRGGNVSASLCLVGDPNYIREKMETLAKKVINTASEISRSMGYFSEALTFPERTNPLATGNEREDEDKEII